MSIPKTGNVSLVAVRNDLGLSGSFSMNSRAAKQKLNWDDSSRSLTQYRANCLGMQLQSGGMTLSTYSVATSNAAYGGSIVGEPSGANSQTKYPDLPRQTEYMVLESRRNGNADSWSENRHQAIVAPSGGASSTNILIELFGKTKTGNQYQYCQIAVIESSSGFLSGTQNTLLTRKVDLMNWGKFTNFSLYVSKDRPYVSVIIYSISKSGAQTGVVMTNYYTALSVKLR